MRLMAEIVMLFFVFMIPWENTITFPGWGTLNKFIGGLAIVVGVIYSTIHFRLKVSPFIWAAGTFVVWSWISVIWSIDPRANAARNVTYTGLLLMSWIVTQLLDERFLKRLFLAYLLGCWIAALGTAVLFLKGIPAKYGRYAMIGFDPNDLAILLSLGIPIVWYVVTHGVHRPFEWLLWTYILVAIIAILLTASRAGFVACIITIIFILWKARKAHFVYKIALFINTALLALSLRYIPEYLIQRQGTIIEEITKGTLNFRGIVWDASIRIFTHHPIIGVGAGNFGGAIEDILGIPTLAHNAFISIGVELGLIGLILWTVMIGLALLGITKKPKGEEIFWVTLFVVLLISLSVLCYEWRKITWLLLTLFATSISNTIENAYKVKNVNHISRLALK